MWSKIQADVVKNTGRCGQKYAIKFTFGGLKNNKKPNFLFQIILFKIIKNFRKCNFFIEIKDYK